MCAKWVVMACHVCDLSNLCFMIKAQFICRALEPASYVKKVL